MSDTLLRTRLIRLASEHPEFRKDLLPLISSGVKSARDWHDSKVKQYVPQLSRQVEFAATDYASTSDTSVGERAARILMATGARIALMGAAALESVATENASLEGEARVAVQLAKELCAKFPRVER